MQYKITTLLLASFLIFLNGCTHQPLIQNKQAAQINHVVLLWLKDPGNLNHRQQIIQATRELAVLPGVEKISVGEVVNSERPVVDDSFDIGIHMLFSNKAALKSYQQHPKHVHTIKEVIRPLINKILVYDFKE